MKKNLSVVLTLYVQASHRCISYETADSTKYRLKFERTLQSTDSSMKAGAANLLVPSSNVPSSNTTSSAGGRRSTLTYPLHQMRMYAEGLENTLSLIPIIVGEGQKEEG